MLFQRLLDKFPAGANPFHYDAISVGMTLEQIGLPDVYVMDSSSLGPGLYVYNKETGQRVKILGVNQERTNTQRALDETLVFVEPYLKNRLTNTQAIRLGRELHANLLRASDAKTDRTRN